MAQEKKQFIMTSEMPEANSFDKQTVKDFEFVKELVTNVRNARKENNVPYKDQLELIKIGNNQAFSESYREVIAKLCNLKSFEESDEKPEGSVTFIINTIEFALPLGENINIEDEIKKLEEELGYTEGFLKSVVRKLSNESFVNNAPEAVVAKEKQKQADAESKIQALKNRISELIKMV
jgi:valyl-tRNA synthetase